MKEIQSGREQKHIILTLSREFNSVSNLRSCTETLKNGYRIRCWSYLNIGVIIGCTIFGNLITEGREVDTSLRKYIIDSKKLYIYMLTVL